MQIDMKAALLGNAVRAYLAGRGARTQWETLWEWTVTTKESMGSNGARKKLVFSSTGEEYPFVDVFPFSEGDIVRLTVDGVSAEFIPAIIYYTSYPGIEHRADFGNGYLSESDDSILDTGYDYSVIWWRIYSDNDFLPYDYPEIWFHSRTPGTYNVKIERLVTA